MSTTLDQLVARKISQGTTLPSLELASETTIQVAPAPRAVTTVDAVLRDATSPLPMEFNPRRFSFSCLAKRQPGAGRDFQTERQPARSHQ
jgi:hypothetical protein